MVLLSIDSGTGTTKLMARFETQEGSQCASDVLLIDGATGKSVDFSRLYKLFG